MPTLIKYLPYATLAILNFVLLPDASINTVEGVTYTNMFFVPLLLAWMQFCKDMENQG